ncbi:ATP-binding SpoIIE family protein phosphatase [Streptomyces coeruleorubidus]|uniref:ATP-binding SpoIIE family protein phosphatase n=1 Tax=Streptomyces coeruleorubidus TaxID=116188 RepID=UPI00368F8475
MHATATMVRLRAAIHTLADLELDPGELLTRLDAFALRRAAEAPGEFQDTVGAMCLYAVYDPVTCQLAVASAGHPPPVVVRPTAPKRACGSLPVHVCAWGESRTDRLTAQGHPGTPLREVGRSILSGIGDRPAREDVALLLARTRAVRSEKTAAWEFRADPTAVAVAVAREETARRLTVYSTTWSSPELVVSELVINAIRYAGGSVGLRLIRENVLICGVTDSTNTQPRLRRARSTDEGGRGLFLVAQLTSAGAAAAGRRARPSGLREPSPGRGVRVLGGAAVGGSRCRSGGAVRDSQGRTGRAAPPGVMVAPLKGDPSTTFTLPPWKKRRFGG